MEQTEVADPQSNLILPKVVHLWKPVVLSLCPDLEVGSPLPL